MKYLKYFESSSYKDHIDTIKSIFQDLIDDHYLQPLPKSYDFSDGAPGFLIEDNTGLFYFFDENEINNNLSIYIYSDIDFVESDEEYDKIVIGLRSLFNDIVLKFWTRLESVDDYEVDCDDTFQNFIDCLHEGYFVINIYFPK